MSGDVEHSSIYDSDESYWAAILSEGEYAKSILTPMPSPQRKHSKTRTIITTQLIKMGKRQKLPRATRRIGIRFVA